MSFKLRALTLAVATLSAVSAHSAGLDRSGQDITGFLQDGTYADVIYTKIDADVSGKDTFQRETGDLAPSYDFFRYTAKTDINDRFSVGVMYDEPFGASVEYQGTNNFTGAANAVASNTIASVANLGTLNRLEQAVETVEKAHADFENRVGGGANQPNVNNAYLALAGLFGGSYEAVEKVIPLVGNVPAETIAQGLEAQIAQSQPAINAGVALVQKGLVDSSISGIDKATLANLLKNYSDSANRLVNAPTVLKYLTSDNGGTKVDVHTKNITALVGMKLGEKRNVQVYAGPAIQKLNGEVHLRGNTYASASGYDANISTDTALGWVAGVSYSKPEIALKASLTYRSEIEHETSIAEYYPLAPLVNLPLKQTTDFRVSLPESINFDFQTGLSAKHRLLGTAKVRYVPWGDFAITPPLYNQVSKTRPEFQKDGLNIVDYAKDQWSAELGLAKQVNDKLAVSGTVGWDSGAGNPATTLGPIEGYYSVGLGAKYNITPNWALSAGAKYLKFGDATAQLPDHTTKVGEFSGNDGYIVGLKLSYQQK